MTPLLITKIMPCPVPVEQLKLADPEWESEGRLVVSWKTGEDPFTHDAGLVLKSELAQYIEW